MCTTWFHWTCVVMLLKELTGYSPGLVGVLTEVLTHMFSVAALLLTLAMKVPPM